MNAEGVPEISRRCSEAEPPESIGKRIRPGRGDRDRCKKLAAFVMKLLSRHSGEGPIQVTHVTA